MPSPELEHTKKPFCQHHFKDRETVTVSRISLGQGNWSPIARLDQWFLSRRWIEEALNRKSTSRLFERSCFLSFLRGFAISDIHIEMWYTDTLIYANGKVIHCSALIRWYTKEKLTHWYTKEKLIHWYTNGNVIAHGLETGDFVRGFDITFCTDTDTSTNTDTDMKHKYKYRYRYEHKHRYKYRYKNKYKWKTQI